MLDDLKLFRVPDPWPEICGYALFALLFLCWIADRMGWLT